MLSSMAGHKGGSLGHAHYGATKGAILALTRGTRSRAGAQDPGKRCISRNY